MLTTGLGFWNLLTYTMCTYTKTNHNTMTLHYLKNVSLRTSYSRWKFDCNYWFGRKFEDLGFVFVWPLCYQALCTYHWLFFFLFACYILILFFHTERILPRYALYRLFKMFSRTGHLNKMMQLERTWASVTSLRRMK